MPLYPSIFQSTLSVRRATGTWDSRLHGLTISIHALREESDGAVTSTRRPGDISIHALREESDWLKAATHTIADTFQSTLSVRRATRVETWVGGK